jgi:tetratricopeptide (TPR) repeat protein
MCNKFKQTNMKLMNRVGIGMAMLTLIVGMGHAQQAPKKDLVDHYSRAYVTAIRLNDYDVAKDALLNLWVANPANDSILFSLSYLYLEMGKYPSAVISSQELLKRNQRHMGAMEISAMAFENLGIKDKALENYEQLYLSTDDPGTLYKMAWLQFELSKFSESKTNADILINRKELEDATVYFTLSDGNEMEFPIKTALYNLKGMIAKEQGDKVNARKFFEEALKISPEFSIAKENIAQLK